MKKNLLIFFTIFIFLFLWFFLFQKFLFSNEIKVEEQTNLTKHFLDVEILTMDEFDTESIELADRYLNNESFGVVIFFGKKMFYIPYQILAWHFGLVFDVNKNSSLFIYYSPFCENSGAFQISSQQASSIKLSNVFYENDPVYVFSNSKLFSPISQKWFSDSSENDFKQVQSQEIRWDILKNNFPETRILKKPKTKKNIDYTLHPYDRFFQKSTILYPHSKINTRLSASEKVAVIKNNDSVKAYRYQDILQGFLKNDRIGDNQVKWNVENQSIVETTINDILTQTNTMRWACASSLYEHLELYESP